MIIRQIPTGIRRLHNHLLAADGPASEGQLVAGAAPGRLVAALDADGRPAVRRRLVDRPRALVGAHEGGAAAVAPGPRVAAVVEDLVVAVACLDGRARVALHGPGAGWFARWWKGGVGQLCCFFVFYFIFILFSFVLLNNNIYPPFQPL